MCNSFDLDLLLYMLKLDVLVGVYMFKLGLHFHDHECGYIIEL